VRLSGVPEDAGERLLTLLYYYDRGILSVLPLDAEEEHNQSNVQEKR